ncbi:hypothetical protein BD311DRAFT_749193 [Dichomitus squalens]|uniref:Uncharacterized protein n=1 Tax=Dichomitus squalens TaxID=114155 RepID=A0A4Q9MYC0_9APHY|nr:hypothetical protein BD311DRAFT_749193 [Dichomitus squalens]
MIQRMGALSGDAVAFWKTGFDVSCILHCYGPVRNVIVAICDLGARSLTDGVNHPALPPKGAYRMSSNECSCRS